MKSDYKEWTAGHVVDFHEWAGDDGRMNPSTAAARGTAVKRVFEYVYGDEWGEQPVKDLDVDDLFHRFGNKAKFDLSHKSIETYQGRFQKALDSYKLFHEDPKAWGQKMQAASRGSTPADSQNGDGPKSKPKAKTTPKGRGNQEPSSLGETPDGMIDYPFVVRPGVKATLRLPEDLRGPEVKRLTAFLQSLPMEEQPALSSGTSHEE